MIYAKTLGAVFYPYRGRVIMGDLEIIFIALENTTPCS